jgi:rhodopsin domain-containing protein
MSLNSPSGDLSAPSGANQSQTQSISLVVISWTILLALSLLTYVLRLYTRLRPRPRLQWDDHTMTVGILLMIAFYISNMMIEAILGRPLTIKLIEKTLLLVFLDRLLWIWSVTMIKLSVTIVILRIRQERHWQRGLYFLIAVLLLAAIGNSISILLACRPIKANWNIELLLTPGTCQSEHTTVILIWATSSKFLTPTSFHPLTFRSVLRPYRCYLRPPTAFLHHQNPSSI